ncbi:MAG TPA: acyl-CoA dehydrogenase family protein [Solirubrobacteraceae bacterium]
MPSTSPLQSAEALAPLAAELAVETERGRALPQALVDAMREDGLFHMCLPRELGGGEAAPAEMVLALEALARADGAASWCAMIGSTSSLLGAYLPAEEAARVYGGGRTIVGGVFAPRGSATRTADGYVVSGRWPFGSGIAHSEWMMGGCLVAGEAGPELLDGGRPDVRLMLMPRAQLEVIDTWTVMGLCGTGSHDFAVEEQPVPAALGVSLFTERPRATGPLYSFPLFGLLAVGICAVALGIARGAIDDLVALAAAKRPMPGARALAERGTVQAELARAEAELRAARAFVLDACREAWQAAGGGEALADRHRLALRLAATHATHVAAEVAGSAYRLAGGGAIYASSALQRRFRDAHVATQHMMVAPATWELTGRLLLGQPTDTSQL